MTPTLSALASAVYAQLTGDPDYAALVTDTSEDPTRAGRAVFPYVVIGEETDVEASPMQTVGHDVTLTLHVWSQARVKTEAQTIIAAIRDVLHRRPLTVMGHRVIAGSMHVEQTDLFRDEDEQLVDQGAWHGVVRVRAQLEDLAIA